MTNENTAKTAQRLAMVTDREGNEFICPLGALRDPETLSEEEKGRCIGARAPRGLVSPL